MRIDGVSYRTIWLDPEDGWSVRIIDQTRLPWRLEILRLVEPEQAFDAIHTMQVRGAPLIGATAAYGMALAVRKDPSTEAIEYWAQRLADARPTA